MTIKVAITPDQWIGIGEGEFEMVPVLSAPSFVSKFCSCDCVGSVQEFDKRFDELWFGPSVAVIGVWS
jgi:hypothetical protein